MSNSPDKNCEYFTTTSEKGYRYTRYYYECLKCKKTYILTGSNKCTATCASFDSINKFNFAIFLTVLLI